MKHAIVTGSTKGIGYAIGLYLLQNNCEVVFNYSNDDERASEVCKKLDNMGFKGKYQILRANLSSISGIKTFEENLEQRFKKLDYLILNTAITKRGSLSDITIDDWQNVINTNLTVPLFMVQLCQNWLQNTGCVLFVGSVIGEYAHAMSIPYGTSKAAIHYLTKSLVKEFENQNVRVNCIAPGFVETEWQKNKPESIKKSIENKVALHRFATPEEIAHMAYSILTNTYINGSIVNIDGGYCYK